MRLRITRFIITLLSRLPRTWLERAIRKHPDVFSIVVITGQDALAMAQNMAYFEEGPLDKRSLKENNNANVH